MSDPDDFDDLDDLAAAIRAATPEPDAARKAADLALARKNFDALQGSRDGLRPTPDRPRRGLLAGVKDMFAQIGHRGLLAGSTALVALGLVVALPQLTELPGRAPMRAEVGSDDATLADAEREAPETLAEPIIEAPVIVEETAALPSAPDQAMGRAMKSAPAPAMQRPVPLPDMRPLPEADTEAFAHADPNPVKRVAEEPVSTFSVDVDTASWSILRSSLMRGDLPPAEAVRIEEMVNYFPYAYPAPEPAAAFRPTLTLTQTPWNADTRLLRVAIQGALPPVADRPPLNLVFLIDTSGSMQDADKLPLLKQSLSLMLSQLRPEDEVAIVTYAGSAGQVLTPTPAADRAAILGALDRLEAGGSTAGQEGLQQAYAVAEGMTADGEVSRILLATDGDFNVGLSDPEALKDYIAGKRDGGTYLSVLGFGRGNLDDATMQALAQNGNGTAAYIDTLSEAQKVLSDQLTGALFPIADDVKIQVEFNPAEIAEYRLIGYETRALRREDFNNDAVDAGDIGAGLQVTALYELTPVGSAAILNDALRYQPAPVVGDAGEPGWFKLRYKAPGQEVSQLIETALPSETTDPDAELRFAAAIAGFGQLLRGGTYLGGWSWDDAITLANGARGDDPFGYRAEAVRLMRMAETLSAR
ncbi:vWA domain-containing protein [Mesobacterium pallidum]|uniref:vWA domain-containing protein n=1 Tax=Mesobacterium pallidum TaxID=2872037 RepID=UPI001EE22A2A|nr:VWA domain-containing protein [Mesobacterium pallidum]